MLKKCGTPGSTLGFFTHGPLLKGIMVPDGVLGISQQSKCPSYCTVLQHCVCWSVYCSASVSYGKDQLAEKLTRSGMCSWQKLVTLASESEGKEGQIYVLEVNGQQTKLEVLGRKLTVLTILLEREVMRKEQREEKKIRNLKTVLNIWSHISEILTYSWAL